MAFFNIYQKFVSNAQMGSPAQSTDITDGFFRLSLDHRTHSTKHETTYADRIYACLVVDDEIWEVYESQAGTPVLFHRASARAYNALSDVFLAQQSDFISIALVRNGVVEHKSLTIGLRIQAIE